MKCSLRFSVNINTFSFWFQTFEDFAVVLDDPSISSVVDVVITLDSFDSRSFNINIFTIYTIYDIFKILKVLSWITKLLLLPFRIYTFQLSFVSRWLSWSIVHILQTFENFRVIIVKFLSFLNPQTIQLLIQRKLVIV